jgi:hypothetical protein
MIIEIDAFKKQIEGYDPKRSEDFHEESAKLADRYFYAELKTGKYSEVVFLAGGAASGKTEFASIFLQDTKMLVYDGTMQNITGFEIKLKKIIKYIPSVKIKVILITPADLSVAYKVFLGRERVMNDDTFVRTQINSKLSVLKILDKYPDIEVQIFTNFINESLNASSIFQKIESEDIPSVLEHIVNDSKTILPKIVNNDKINTKETE